MKDWHARHADIARAMAELTPRTLQANVRDMGGFENAGRWHVRLSGVLLSVILEVECHSGELWAHLSICGQRPARAPTWDELRWCKDYFLGADRKALSVLPSRAEYVNIHPNVLHLWCPLERDPLPDFRAMNLLTGEVQL